MDTYNFDPAEAYNSYIAPHLLNWAIATHAKRFVVGMSGGKDSTIVAMLLVKLFGPDYVQGVSLPNNDDYITDGENVSAVIGIKCMQVNIAEACKSITNGISGNNMYITDDCRINLPARIRMSTLFAVGQCINGRVINTSNLSEDTVGYATQFGDNAGCYAPIQGLTVTEVKQLGMWLANELGLNETVMSSWINKTPEDGLQSLSDEERLGFTYEALDRYIRLNEGSDEFRAKINKLYRLNKFKTDIVQMPQPRFPYPNYVKTI